jgi:hypothetical protein
MDGAGGLRGLAADVVEGEAMEEGTGGVWGGTCNYREKIVIATSHTTLIILYTQNIEQWPQCLSRERGRLLKVNFHQTLLQV